jgi:hypothetical protein
MSEVLCFHCKKKVPLLVALGRKEECPFCRWDLHVCRNCEFFDSQSYNECREPQAEVVREKERANFCDYFRPRSTEPRAGKTAADLLAAAEALFKKN